MVGKITLSVMLLAAFILGLFAGVLAGGIITTGQISKIVEHIQIEELNIELNETKLANALIDYVNKSNEAEDD